MCMRLLHAVLLLATTAVPSRSYAEKKHWVGLDSSGDLVYRTLPKGDQIIDFSYAGYMAGGVPLPSVPTVLKLAPSGTDDSVAIQHAIDQVSLMPLRNGFRGAVVLAPGTFICSKALSITTSGVVLRGSGPLAGGTTLKLTGEPHAAITVAGKEEVHSVGFAAHILQAYVPSGAHSITLDNASGFRAGDAIRITRYTTPQWLHYMGMDKMMRDGEPETWVGDSISTLRVVTGHDGNSLNLDVPVADSYDRKICPPKVLR